MLIKYKFKMIPATPIIFCQLLVAMVALSFVSPPIGGDGNIIVIVVVVVVVVVPLDSLPEAPLPHIIIAN